MCINRKMMIHHIRRVKSVPCVIDQHFRFENTFFNEIFNFPDLFNVPIMSVVKSVVVVMEVIRIECLQLLSSFVGFISLT